MWKRASRMASIPNRAAVARCSSLPSAGAACGHDPHSATRHPEICMAHPLAAEAAPTLRGRLRTLPPLSTTGLWPAQVTAINNLEKSLAQEIVLVPLIQMATGSGQNLHRHQLHLSPYQVWRGQAPCSSWSIAATSATRRWNSSSTSPPYNNFKFHGRVHGRLLTRRVRIFRCRPPRSWQCSECRA